MRRIGTLYPGENLFLILPVHASCESSSFGPRFSSWMLNILQHHPVDLHSRRLHLTLLHQELFTLAQETNSPNNIGGDFPCRNETIPCDQGTASARNYARVLGSTKAGPEVTIGVGRRNIGDIMTPPALPILLPHPQLCAIVCVCMGSGQNPVHALLVFLNASDADLTNIEGRLKASNIKDPRRTKETTQERLLARVTNSLSIAAFIQDVTQILDYTLHHLIISARSPSKLCSLHVPTP